MQMYQYLLRLCAGGFSLLTNLVQASNEVLGYAVPQLNLASEYQPLCVLGYGNNTTVYEAISTAELYAVKVGSPSCTYM